MYGVARTGALLTLAIVVFAPRASAFTIQGTVLDPGGAPVAAAKVWLNHEHVPRTADTDADGRFAFAGVPSDHVQLVVHAPNFALAGVEGPCVRDEDIRIVLAPIQPTRLRVIDRAYEPVEGARVSRLVVNDRFTVEVDDLAPLGFPVGRSDENGYLNLPPLPRDAFASITIACNGFADGHLPALPSGIEDLDVPLPEGEPVVGRITNSAGAGVPRARVSIYRPREDADPIRAAEAVSGPEGFYRALVPHGAYLVAARHPGYAMPAPAPIEVRALGGDVVADLQLPDPHRIDGRALDNTGSPVALARFAYHLDDYVVDEAVSDTRGRFELTVPAGQGAVHITPPYRMATREFPRVYLVVRDGQPPDPIAVEFRPLPEIHSRALFADGAPAARTLVTSLNLEPPQFVVTDDQGKFTISLDEFPEEPVKFRAESAIQPQRAEFELKPDRLELTDIRLREYTPDAAVYPERGVNDLRALVGRPAPDFACDAWLNGPAGTESLSVETLRGKVVVLTLWAGFDFLGPSRARANELNAIFDAYEGIDDVALVGIHDSSVEPGDVARYVRELGIRYPVGCDQDPYETFARYGTQQIPQTVLIDKRGIVRHFATDGRLLELIKVLRDE